LKSQPQYPGMQRDKRMVRVRHDGAAGVIELSAENYTPQRSIVADYVSVDQAEDGVRIVFGKRKTFQQGDRPRLSYVLEISFPHFQFCAQLFTVIDGPGSSGEPFVETVRRTQIRNGYSEIREMPPAVDAEKEAHIRANAALLAVVEDDISIDFVHLDAMTAHLATKGEKVPDNVSGVRVIMAPNVALFFMSRVAKVANELFERTPGLRRKQE
jgi:hypothetical protein